MPLICRRYATAIPTPYPTHFNILIYYLLDYVNYYCHLYILIVVIDCLITVVVFRVLAFFTRFLRFTMGYPEDLETTGIIVRFDGIIRRDSDDPVPPNGIYRIPLVSEGFWYRDFGDRQITYQRDLTNYPPIYTTTLICRFGTSFEPFYRRNFWFLNEPWYSFLNMYDSSTYEYYDGTGIVYTADGIEEPSSVQAIAELAGLHSTPKLFAEPMPTDGSERAIRFASHYDGSCVTIKTTE